MTYYRLPAHLPPVGAELIFGIRGVIAAALAVVVITFAAGGTANAQGCRKNYYPCSLNRGGKVDRANPGAAGVLRRAQVTVIYKPAPAVSTSAT